jgi:hypothetical protein
MTSCRMQKKALDVRPGLRRLKEFLWALNGGRLVQLHRDWAVIDVPVNRSERVFYRRNVDVAKITLPWRKRD